MYFIKNICLLCLKESDLIQVSLTDSENEVCQLILHVLPELAQEHLNLPIYICCLCHQQLKNIYLFKKMCMNNFNRWKFYIEKLQGTQNPVEEQYNQLNVNINLLTQGINYQNIITNLSEAKEDLNLFSSTDQDYCLLGVNISEQNGNVFLTLEEKDLSKLIKQEIIDSSENTDIIQIKQEPNLDDDIFFQQYDINNNNSPNSTNGLKNFHCLISKKPPPKPAEVQSNIKKTHTCTICNKNYSSKPGLNFHMKTHSGNKQHQCTVCNKAFYKNYYLKQHMNVHLGIKAYKCQICNKKFTFRKNLTRHSNIHSNKYKCKVCNKNYAQKIDLEHHKRLHSSYPEFKCNICNENFLCETNLNYHQNIHKLNMKFKCEICNKEFILERYFNAHMNKHKEEQSYDCRICKKNFSTKSHLKEHTLIHTNMYRYKCEQCYKEFSQKRYLTQHSKIHFNVKTILCIICSREFSNKSNLNRHMKIHTNFIESNKPVVCLSKIEYDVK